MSNERSESQGGGGQRRRSRGGRNRNRNRNRRNDSEGKPRNDQREGNPQNRGENRGNHGNRSRSGGNDGRRRQRQAPKPVPLTWWQKLLKAVGLYKEPTPPARAKKSAPKSNTRVAKGHSDTEKPQGERKPRKRKPRTDNDEHRERRVPENVEVESNRLYLGNLSYEASENDIEELFKGIGNVRRVEIVYNRQTHRSKGYGFIDMMNRDEAKRAVEVLHDQFFMGRRLVVNGAKSQAPADVEGDEPPAEKKPAEEEPSPLNIEEPVPSETKIEEHKA